MGTPAEQILLHRPPMLLVDELIECAGDHAVARVCFANRPYCIAEGFVCEPALAEAMAQTVAAHFGCAGTPAPGMLAAIDGFECLQAVRPEWTLEIAITITRRLPPFCAATGAIRHQGETIAAGSMKFFIGELPAETQPAPKNPLPKAPPQSGVS
ncbi:MAG TPA: hypothetical protein PLO62_01885 [Candidatus Hydrogenedentes bacterium]|nr:hypothetical protein [Candidatus Hydrogenedentota bacterium]